MAEATAASHKNVKIKTTLPVRPLPSSAERPHIRTERLVVRPFRQDDLASYHALRSQPEVMLYSLKGRPDKDLAETQQALDNFLPPRDAYKCAVCLASTGEVIGVGGCKPGPFMGWPELGYMFNKEHWNQGYATEWLRAFLGLWWEVPRQEVEIEADARSAPDVVVAREGRVPEQLAALIDAANAGSRRLLEKCGFRRVAEWTEPDCREGFEGAEVTLAAYAISRPN